VDGSSAVIDRRTMRVQRRLPAADGPFDEELGFLPDGRRLVTAGAGGTATLWDAARGVTLRRLRFGGQVLGGAVSPDGRLVAVQWQAPGSTGSTVEVRDLASDRTRYTRAMSAGAGMVAFAAGGGEIVATGCCLGGSTIAAWDARSGAPVFRRTPRAPVISLSAWPDARRFLVGTQDGRVLALDARTGRQIGPATTVSASPVTQVAASHDGRLFASAARNGTLTLWDLRTRRRIGDQFPVGPSTIPGVVFEPGGRLVVNDQISRSAEWPLDLATLRRAACSIAGRDITREEWRNLVPDRPYERVCPA
jgi:WD40 repeat protein